MYPTRLNMKTLSRSSTSRRVIEQFEAEVARLRTALQVLTGFSPLGT